MATLVLNHNQEPHKFPIHGKECYVNWDKFCVGSLNSAKDEINKKRVFRYKSITNKNAEEARLRHVTAGIVDIVKFIEEHGWKIFVAVALGFALTAVGGASMALFATNPVTLVLGGVAVVGGASVVSYYGYKLYKHRELVVKVKNLLSPVKTTFDRYQPGYKRRNKPRIQVLYDVSVKEIIEKIYECEIMVDDLSLPINPICLCGEILVPKLNVECYGNEYSYIICDICDHQIQDKKDVYHCPQKKIEIHPDGYDVCIKCARNHNTKFKRYHAVVIQSLSEQDPIGCKDGKALKALFESLNYHEIIMIDPQHATRSYIMSKLSTMKMNQKNDVVVICYSGHGSNRNDHWMCYLESNETITDQELVQFVELGHNAYAPSANDNNVLFGDTCDVVILLNACFSGKFSVKRPDNNNQQVDDEKMPQHLVNYDNLGKCMITIAACGSEEEGNYFGGISPFYKFVIEEMKNNQNATPETVHQHIKHKTEQQKIGGLKLSDLQHVQRAYKQGQYALHVPLCPAVKKY